MPVYLLSGSPIFFHSRCLFLLVPLLVALLSQLGPSWTLFNFCRSFVTFLLPPKGGERILPLQPGESTFFHSRGGERILPLQPVDGVSPLCGPALTQGLPITAGCLPCRTFDR